MFRIPFVSYIINFDNTQSNNKKLRQKIYISSQMPSIISKTFTINLLFIRELLIRMGCSQPQPIHDPKPVTIPLQSANSLVTRTQANSVIGKQNPEKIELNSSYCHEIIVSPGKDRRILNKQIYKYPYNCIVKLTFVTKDKKQLVCGTGILIGARQVLTSAHYLKKYDEQANKKKPIMVEPSECSNQNMYSCFMHFIKSHQDYYYPETYNQKQPIQDDFGIIILQQGIDRPRYIKLAINFDFHNYVAQLCGYPLEQQILRQEPRPQNIHLRRQIHSFVQVDSAQHASFKQKKMKGILLQTSKNYILYDIDTTPGQSGSPVLIQINGQLYVIGIHSGNYYTITYENGEKIKRVITQNQISISVKDKYNSACKLRSYHYQKIQQICLKKKLQLSKPFDLQGITLKFPFNYYKVIQRKDRTREQKKKMCSNVYVSSIDPEQNKNFQIQTLVPTLQMASSYFKQERNRQSLAFCYKILQEPEGMSEKQIIQTLSLMGLNYQDLGLSEYSDFFYQKCYQRLFFLEKSQISTYVEVNNNIGTAFLQKDDKKSARLFFQQASMSIKKNNMKDNQLNAATLANLSIFDQQQGKYDEALQKLTNALEILSKISQARNGQKILVLQQLIGLLFKLKKYEEWLNCLLKHFEFIIEIKIQQGITYNIYEQDQQRIISSLSQNSGKSSEKNILTSSYIKWYQLLFMQIQEIFQPVNRNSFDKRFLLTVAVCYLQILRGITLKDERLEKVSKLVDDFMQMQQYSLL